MAGWKLRKDKTSAETTDAEADVPSEPQNESNLPGNNFQENSFQEGSLHESSLHEELAPPAFDAGSGTEFADLDFDSDLEEPKLGQAEQGDGSLTLVDYTEPKSEYAPETERAPEAEYAPFASPPHYARVFEMPEPSEIYPKETAPTEIAPIGMPPPEFGAAPAAEAAAPVIGLAAPVLDVIPTAEDDFQQRLRTGRFEAGELASPPASGLSSAGIPTVAPFVLDTPPPAAPPAAVPQLVIHVGRLSAAFDVTKDVTTIGRPDSAMHYYPDVEIETDDAISRRHAEVVKRESGYYLVDTGSTNGTRLNGSTLPAHEEHLLAYGDRIHVGERTEIVFG